MMEEMALLRSSAKGSSSSGSTYQTPPPKVAAPSPSPKDKSKTQNAVPPGKPPKPPSQQVVAAAQAPPPPKSEGAKLARLRRICEMKPSGRCAAGLEVHERWKKADKSEREAMVEELEKANWSKDS